MVGLFSSERKTLEGKADPGGVATQERKKESEEGLKLAREVETYYLKRVYAVSSDFSRSEWESPR